MIYKMGKVPVFLEDGDMRLNSPFAPRTDPISGKKNTPHKGVDIVRFTTYATTATITAIADGVVTAVKTSVKGVDTANSANSAGNYVTVDHGNGWVTKYFHLKYGTVAVAKGQKVKRGDVLGYMGNTGYSSGAHLHFQLEKDGEAIDGLPYLLGDESIIPITQTPSDSVPHEWAKEAVEWAKANGIIFGDEHGNLRLSEPCTREQMLVFLHRA
ncbi:MAG: peptidoglycan DD-metalloendopeptidase family protein, partial [Clostridia bacterium]|nr:peptidoglycan DD-metalloendopeptidase family protein [Clostridia bacterium]